MTPIHSPIEQFIIISSLKVSFFPSAKSNILKEILGVGGQAHFFENTRKLLIDEHALDDIMCIGSLYVASFYTKTYQEGIFLLESPKVEYVSQSPKH